MSDPTWMTPQNSSASVGWRGVARWLLLGALLLVALWLPPHTRAQPEQGSQAGIVIQFADGQMETFCVELGADGSATGEEVLRATGLPTTIEYSGGNGGAVCQIDSVGCDFPAESCFCECTLDPNEPCVYWNYSFQENGEWQYASIGSTNRTVEAGDVEGWVWGAGEIATGALPPLIPFDDICLAPTPTATRRPTQTRTATPTASATPTLVPTATETEAPASVTPSRAASATRTLAASTTPATTAPPAASATRALPSATLAATSTGRLCFPVAQQRAADCHPARSPRQCHTAGRNNRAANAKPRTQRDEHLRAAHPARPVHPHPCGDAGQHGPAGECADPHAGLHRGSAVGRGGARGRVAAGGDPIREPRRRQRQLAPRLPAFRGDRRPAGGRSLHAAGPRTMREKALSGAIYTLTTVIGILAFLYPFFVPVLRVPGAMQGAHSADAPFLLSLLVGICFVVLLLEVQGQAVSAKLVALLGVLVAINSVLRFVEVAIPAPGGISPIFFLIGATGYVYGGRFGFLMGALTLLVSALITAGIGPWLPYQMLAAGWMGLSAPLCRPLVRALRLTERRGEVLLLALFIGAWGFVYGIIMNLWFWPFAVGPSAHYWEAGIGVAAIVQRYAAFYLATSFVWDAFGALGNLVLTLLFGRATLRALRRFHRRFHFSVMPAPRPAEPAA